ncbi:MAG: DNA gyrase inhibitor YacG [Gammaproteobacteria bacterium]
MPWTVESEWKPFCSERCKLIDLGDWLLEKHAIPGDTHPEDQDDAGG